jgi:putative restriction endonuclease
MLQLYGGRCAVSGDAPATVLEAAHIIDHATSGINADDNGILLRADLHLLFDAGLLRIEPKRLRVVLDKRLKDTPYWRYHGKMLRARITGSRFSRGKLRQRWGGG